MTTVYLIRHAEAEGNLYRRAHGHFNSGVTERGYRQIAALAKRFADVPVDAVYASDLVRTQTTALSITRTHGLALHIVPELREIGVGEWEDRTWAWLAQFERERLLLFNTDLARWHVSGGEDIDVVRDRTVNALHGIIAAHPDKTVAVFSHGMALRTLVGTLQGMSIAEIDRSPHAENTAVTKIEADAGGVRVIFRDDASHLGEALATLRKQAWTKSEGGVEPGIWFEPDADAPGRFAAHWRDSGVVGAVAVEKLGGSTASITEFRLSEALRGQKLGIRLMGQAVSAARALGCDTLRAALTPAAARALCGEEEYGFRIVSETPEGVIAERYFGSDEAYRVRRFDEAMREG